LGTGGKVFGMASTKAEEVKGGIRFYGGRKEEEKEQGRRAIQ